ncbi:MAG: dihydrolipoyl dehydrogenase [Acidimicrobiales bacterium]|nr:dihydrolipoyl dehydrogenase [Acidimicrobiales bacterium]
MVVGELSERTDVAIIGGGPGGYAAALRLASHGRKVVLIERNAIGGVCLNVGCIPSKTLIHQAELAWLPRSESHTGVNVSVHLNPAAMLAHRQQVVASLTSGVTGLLKAAGVVVWNGEARFARPDRLSVQTSASVKHVEFDHCLIATGSRPVALPSLHGDGSVPLIDSTGALALDTVPERMVVIGGGYIGVELGTAWTKLGSAVTIVEMGARILPGMDAALAKVVHRRLDELGVTVLANATAETTSAANVVVRSGGDRTEIPASCAVVAIGRRPNTDQLNLDHVGVNLSPTGHIQVAPNRLAAGRIYAIGDVTEGPALAHKATAEADVAADAIVGKPASFDPAVIPEIVFSDPEVASVGAAAGAKAFKFPFSAGSRAQTLGNRFGFIRLVADKDDTIIGAQLAGQGVSELIAELALAIEMAATVTDVADTIHPHPTMSEAVMEAAFGLQGRPLHVRA